MSDSLRNENSRLQANLEGERRAAHERAESFKQAADALAAGRAVLEVLLGVGMVLAGGCVVGTLYKMGAGGIGSVAAFGGLLAGSALYAGVHPAWASFATRAEESWLRMLEAMDPYPVNVLLLESPSESVASSVPLKTLLGWHLAQATLT